MVHYESQEAWLAAVCHGHRNKIRRSKGTASGRYDQADAQGQVVEHIRARINDLNVAMNCIMCRKMCFALESCIICPSPGPRSGVSSPQASVHGHSLLHTLHPIILSWPLPPTQSTSITRHRLSHDESASSLTKRAKSEKRLTAFVHMDA